MKRGFEISWGALWRIFVFALAVYIFYIAREAVGVLFLAIVISLGLDPMVGFLEGKGVNRLLGTVLVFLGGLIVLTVVLFLAVPIVVTEAMGFLGDFNNALSSIFGVSLPPTFIEGLSANLSKILSFLGTSSISVSVAVSQVVSKAILVTAVVVTSFYLSIEKNGTERLLRVILPDVYEKPVLEVFGKFKKKIRRWFGAQLGLSLMVGIVVSLGLWLLGVRYPLVLGLVAALFEIVPIIGPILAGMAALLVAVSSSWMLGLYVTIFFVAVQQLENHVLIPVIMGKTMRVHPVIVIVALLAGGQVAGFVGVLLAVPVAVLANEIFNQLAERKRKGLGV